MKNLIYTLLVLSILSCGDDDEPQPKGLKFPSKFVLTSLEYGETDLYEMDGMNFTKIDLAGSFIFWNQAMEQNIKDDLAIHNPINRIELLDEESARVVIFDGLTGSSKDTTISYQRNGDEIQLSGIPLIYELNEKEERLEFCTYVHWAVYKDRNGDWDPTAPYHTVCSTMDENELIPEIIDINSFAGQLDTIAINFSKFLFDLEE